MIGTASHSARASCVGLSVLCLTICANVASAGGFAVREQSASLMGSAFAGAAAGVDLSSAFWNPAAFGIASNGLSSQSAYSAIFGNTELSNGVTSGVAGSVGGAPATEIDKIGLLSSSYAAYRVSDKVVLGMSISAPFGLATEADNYDWAGRLHGRAADMMTLNFSPTLAYEIAPGVHVAAGLQLEYMKLKLWTAGGRLLPPQPTLSVKLDDTVGVGYTAGILLKPIAGTSLGLGFRSKIDHNLEGDFNTPVGRAAASADLTTPEMLTLSLQQALSANARALATVEWTNWSRLTRVPVNGVPGNAANGGVAVLEADWHDGWFISGGLEYDAMPAVTLRGGVAWEKSPIQNASERLSVLPDSDRIWLTLGGTYRYSDATTFDVSFAHVFFDDAHLTRDTLSGNGIILNADVENSANIVSVGMRTRW